MKLRVTLQDGTVLEADEHFAIDAPHGSRFVHLRDSLGVHFWPQHRLARVTNGVRGDLVGQRCGGVYVAHIDLEDGWVDASLGVSWGSGRDYIPARGCFYIGGSLVGPDMPREIGWGGIVVPLYEQTIPLPAGTQLGSWRLAGPRDYAAPGGTMLEPLPPYRTGLWDLHRRTVARWALDDFDPRTGKPLRTREQGYTGGRGYSSYGQLVAYCERVTATPDWPAADQWSQTRQPLTVNTGQCVYRTELEGTVYYKPNERYHGWDAGWATGHNDQHNGRNYGPALGLAMTGFQPAMFDLAVCEADVAKWYGDVQAWPEQGSSGANRALSWALDVSRFARIDRSADAREIAGAQMPNGQMQRDRDRSGWNPQPTIPWSDDAGQTMEGWLLSHTLTGYGIWEPAERMVNGLFGRRGRMKPSVVRAAGKAAGFKDGGYVPKFVAVAARNGPTYRTIDRWSHGSDYFPWTVLGILACKDIHDGLNPNRWIECMLQINTPTRGKAENVRDLRDKLRIENVGGGQVVAALSAVERVA